MRSIWREGSEILVDGRPVDVARRVAHLQAEKDETVFLIPGQRVITLANGSPKPFQGYSAGDPYSVRAFSEELQILMEWELTGAGQQPRERPALPAVRESLPDHRRVGRPEGASESTASGAGADSGAIAQAPRGVEFASQAGLRGGGPRH
jgi:hypothetical protein